MSVPHESPGLVIFDCDGVLVDSERLTVRVEARVLTEMGWPMSVDEVVRRFMGRSDRYRYAEVRNRLGAERAGRFEEVFDREISEEFRLRLRPVAGVEALVRRLADADIATCIASSGTHQKMDVTLGITGLKDLFEGRIYSASDVANGKPAPDLFLHAAEAMGFRSDACAVVEDSVPGVVAAVAAGMVCHGFAGGLTPGELLEAAGAMPFSSMADLGSRLLPERPI